MDPVDNNTEPRLIAGDSMDICVRVVGGAGWHGGLRYVINLVEALSQTQAAIWLHSPSQDLSWTTEFGDALALCRGLVRIGETDPQPPTGISLPVRSIPTWQAVADEIDLYYPAVLHAIPACSVALSWIPDFQHRHLPDLFTPADRHNRDAGIAHIATVSPGVVFSSNATLADWRRFYPDSSAKTHVLPFVSAMQYQTDPNLVLSVRHRYGLPADYVVCANQFWMHKDHATLFRGLATACQQRNDIHVVLTGAASDYRNTNHYNNLMQLAESLGITPRLSLTGYIPRQDQVQIMRGAKGVIQPSLFEGWSTVLEDARSLGLPVLASDIPVHCEQNPPGMITFRAGDSDDLAARLIASWQQWPSGPNAAREAEAMHHAVALRQQVAERVIELATMYSRRT